MKQPLKLAVLILSIAYPFLIYWGLQHYPAGKLLPLLFLLLGLRWVVGGQSFERAIVIAIIGVLIVIVLVWGQQLGLKFYPVMVNLGFLGLFAGSLIYPPPIVERMARIREPDLSPRGVAYTYKVTWVWIIFFIVNGGIASLTAIWGSDEIWVLYNGFIAYLLIGILAGSEWLLRRRFIKH